MAMKMSSRFIALLVLSTVGASAQSIRDIGLMILVKDGNASPGTCTTDDFNRLAVDLDEKARTFDDSYPGGRRELQDTEIGTNDNHLDNQESGRRELVNCANVCSGFAYGSCKLVYPECAPRRELEEESLEQSVNTSTQNLRGGERQLQNPTRNVLSNGFMSGFSGGDNANPKAVKLCADLTAGLKSQVVSLPDRLQLTGSCDSLWRGSTKIGCVFMSSL
jgi:hypothetical protein